MTFQLFSVADLSKENIRFPHFKITADAFEDSVHQALFFLIKKNEPGYEASHTHTVYILVS